MINFSTLSTKIAAVLAAAAALADGAKAIPDAVQVAEAALGPGNGAQKLEVARAHIASFLSVLGHSVEAITVAIDKLVPFITTIVAVMSSLGVGPFAKKQGT